MKPFRFLFACVVGAAFVLTPPDLPSCGPGFDQAIFTFTRYPRYPVKDYAAGRLGIIHPTYLTRFLWITATFPTSRRRQRSSSLSQTAMRGRRRPRQGREPGFK